MTEDERATMISIGKAVTEQGVAVKNILNLMGEKKELVVSPIQAPKVSVVDHEGPSSRFQMDISFRDAQAWSQQQRMDVSIKLLTEMQELLQEYGVIKLQGNYFHHGLK